MHRNEYAATGDRLHILLVEDNPHDVMLLREDLRDVPGLHFDLATAGDLATAKKHLETGTHDAALVDLGLPDSDGLDTLDALQIAAAGRPIVVLTGLHDETTGRQAVARGAQDYLVKGAVDGAAVARSVLFAIERSRRDAANVRSIPDEQMSELRAAQLLKQRLLRDANLDSRAPTREIRRLIRDIERRLPGGGNNDRETLDALQANIGHLNRIVEDLADVGRLRNGRFAVDREPTDLAALAVDAVGSMSIGVNGDGTTFDRRIREALPVHADVRRMLQVLFHILDNATRLGAGRRIKVEAKRIGDAAVLHVTDEGPGLDTEQAQGVFEPFAQVHTEPAQRGMGLGMCLSKGLVEAQGGRMWCVSPGPGMGATFSLSVPILEANGAG